MNDFLCNNRLNPNEVLCSRRQFLSRCGMGFGMLGLAGLLARDSRAAAGEPGRIAGTHFPPRARRVIHIFAQGAPSHVDTWDPKPALNRYADRSLPGLNGVALPSPFKFSRRGRSGIEVSEVFEALGDHVDEMTVIRSMHTDIPAHDVATVFMNTGSIRMARPSLGSWVLYGLGSGNENMPGYVSLRPGGAPPGGMLNWGAGFLPGNFQAASINTRATSVDGMIENIRHPYTGREYQRRQIDLVQGLNARHQRGREDEAALEARIESFEMAYRMQIEASDAFDITREPAHVRDLYGTGPQGRQLLIARRLIERGVRFVQVWAGGWDHHQDLEERLRQSAAEIDRPAAALLTDLRQRGLLDDTLVIWGGEFGRTVTRDRNDSEDPGRDHNSRAFSLWMAGGGVRGGLVHGATDEFGSRAVENTVHVHDLHATLLHLLGFDHEQLTYRHNGRDFRLTDTEGVVVKGILA